VRERERERERERQQTCRTAPELANLRGRETDNGSVSSAKSAKSIEASPRKPDLDDPCRNS
jgi:hypothetical protein